MHFIFCCIKDGQHIVGYSRSRPLIDCSLFTLHAPLNTNICLDGIQPVCCDCLLQDGVSGSQFIIFMRRCHKKKKKESHNIFRFHVAPTQLHDVICDVSFGIDVKHPVCETQRLARYVFRQCLQLKRRPGFLVSTHANSVSLPPHSSLLP